MEAVPVDFYPLERTYKTAQAAIAGARNNPRQPKAKADSAKLAGTSVVDAWWTHTQFAIRFSNGHILHIWVSPGRVEWEVTDVPPVIGESETQRIGSKPIRYRCGPGAREVSQDWSALTARRRGAEFERLWLNEGGLLVYLRGRLIWFFAVVRRTDLDQPILWVEEST
jgi:hypothetical protein